MLARRNLFRAWQLLAQLLTLGGVVLDPKIEPDREYTFPVSFASSTGPVKLEAGQDAAIDNGGTVAHTVTCTLRSSGNSGTATRQLPAGSSLPISGQGIASFSLDSTDSNVTGIVGPRGSVYPFGSAAGISAAQSKGTSLVAVQMNPIGDSVGYYGILGQVNGNSNGIGVVADYMPFAGTISNLYAKPNTNSLNANTPITLYKNGVATALTITLTAGSSVLVTDLVHSVSFVAGDHLEWQCDTSGSSSGSLFVIVTAQLRA